MVNPLVIVYLVPNCSELWECEIVVVYHLHGQTGRFSVWVNGSQSLGPVNFVPESRLPYVQISSIYRKTAAKVWNWYQRWLWRNETRISVWNIPSGKTGLPFQMFRFSRKFSVGKIQKVEFCLLSNRVSRKIFVNGKQPVRKSQDKVALFPPATNCSLLRGVEVQLSLTKSWLFHAFYLVMNRLLFLM